MTAFALVHGAWHGAWCWEALVPELAALGHRAVAVDLPCDDVHAGADRYADVVAESLAGVDDEVVVVGHSLGGLTIPLLPQRRPVQRLVFLCALLPDPGRSFVGQLREQPIFVPGFQRETRVDELDRSYWPPGAAAADLYRDLPPAQAAAGEARLRPQARAPVREVTPLRAWPEVPVTSIVARADAAVSPDWSREAARARLGVEAVELNGGHSPFLTQPRELARLLDSLRPS